MNMQWAILQYLLPLTYSLTLRKTKHIETKETIQIHWDADELPDIL